MIFRQFLTRILRWVGLFGIDIPGVARPLTRSLKLNGAVRRAAINTCPLVLVIVKPVAPDLSPQRFAMAFLVQLLQQMN